MSCLRWAMVAVLSASLSACAALGLPPPGPGEAEIRAGTLPDAVPPVPPDGALGAAEAHFAAGNFGYAARYFEQAAAAGQGPEAWLGLAAAYDRLGRFDLADRAYARAEPALSGTAAYHNNLGFSRLLRGDAEGARGALALALALAPDDPVVKNNLTMAEASRPVLVGTAR